MSHIDEPTTSITGRWTKTEGMIVASETIRVTRDDSGIPRDQWGRYQLPHPTTGKTQAWTRATTISGTLADRWGLEKWAQRNIVWGIGQRPHLYAKASAARRGDDKTLQSIADDAAAAAAATSGADIGTALHLFTERLDRGEQFDIPPMFESDLNAYTHTIANSGIRIEPEWIERVVAVPDIGVAGTLDRIATHPAWQAPRITDLKTAADKTYDDRTVNTILAYGHVDIPLQLAIYAHATHAWDIDKQQWDEMPPVDQNTALVLHLPAGAAECRLIEMDIAAGWEAVQLALDVRAWRKRRGLATLVDPTSWSANDSGGGRHGGQRDVGTAEVPAHETPAAATPTQAELDAAFLPTRLGWLRERVHDIHHAKVVDSNGVTPIRRLAGLWSQHPHIPTPKNGGPRTHQEADVIAAICELVETEFELDFGPSDPTGEQQ